MQARKLLERCGDTYAEVTVSGTGIRIIGLGISPVNRQKKYPVGDGVSVETISLHETDDISPSAAVAFPAMRDRWSTSIAVIDEVYSSVKRTGPTEPCRDDQRCQLYATAEFEASRRTTRGWPGSCEVD